MEFRTICTKSLTISYGETNKTNTMFYDVFAIPIFSPYVTDI